MTIKEYNACVDVFSDRVYAYALKLLRDTALAEDLVQDVFERLWLKRENVEFEKAKSYLFRSTYNGMIDWSRKEWRQFNLLEALDILWIGKELRIKKVSTHLILHIKEGGTMIHYMLRSRV